MLCGREANWMKPIWSHDENIPCKTCRHEKVSSKKEPCKECLAHEEHYDTGRPNYAKNWEAR